jgi:diguanylate cyclase (GGDEF)-like protein
VAIERAELVSRLESLARTDALTGLPNRRTFEEEFRRHVVRARLGRHALCLALLDLDRFKSYNDERGHQAGDRLLKAAASWCSTLRMTDTLARYGGEEFVTIPEACSLSDALALADRLRAATPGGQTCSIGIAEWDGLEPLESLVARADAALYEAKRSGRDRAVAAQAA